MGKKVAGRVSCSIEIVLYGIDRPEVITSQVFLEDARAFEQALAEHRKWRRRNRMKDRYKQTFTLVDTKGAKAEFAFDAVYTLTIV